VIPVKHLYLIKTMHYRFAKLLWLALLLPLLTVTEAQAQRKKKRQKTADPIEQTIAALRQHVEVLAHDSLEGRRTGTIGEQKAIAYLENAYTQMGLAAAGTQGYRQPFYIDEGKTYKESTTLTLNGQPLKPDTDFFPLIFSGNGKINTEANVALHESGDAWWINLDAILEKNKDNPHFLLHSHLQEVAQKAAADGATAILFFNDGPVKDDLKFLPKDKATPLTIPVVYLTQRAIKQYGITENSAPVVAGEVLLKPVGRTGTNVVAKIDNGAAYTIIIGAHLDHLGYGEDQNSRHTGEPAIHNGADDNASGTAALLELAKMLKTDAFRHFNYWLIHFSGEELGLYGSKFFTENPTTDLSKVNCMINLDMVGRLNDSSKALTIGGVGTSPAWGSLLLPTEHFTFKIDSSGTGPSDHASFYRKDLPVLFFFTGLHNDYHRPEDDADRLNYKGMALIVNYIADLIKRMPAEKLVFTKTKEQNMGGGRGFKVSIGIMPDYTYSGIGVKADGVIAGRPAEKAGLKANDVILQLGEHLITGVDTYMQSLNRFEKGQTTTITIKRGNDILTLPITF
jgi:hypothetical protein